MKLLEKVRLTADRLKTMARRPSRKAPPQKLQARVRASVASTADAYDDEEPQTKLTSAFIVVLILHVVAVGGIYAFNQIKASRRVVDSEASSSASASGAKPTAASDSVEPVSARSTLPASASTSAIQTASVSSGTSKSRTHVVKSGDTLTSIAKQHGVSVAELKSANSLGSDSIRQGQVLSLVQSSPKPVADAVPLKRAEAPTEAKVSTRSYTVKSGDRLIFIAKKYSVQPEELIAYNKISDPTKLQIGQTLKIPPKK